jgi:putative heme iron utilization protein
MTADQIEDLRSLLARQRVLSLSVLVEGAPYIGLLPYALRPDFGAALIHASKLARHSRGLNDGAPFAVLIHAPLAEGADALQVPRVSLQGVVEKVAKDSPAYAAGRDAYLNRFPSSATTFGLGDFDLYWLAFRGGRYVAGFAQAVNLNEENLRELATPSS